MWAVGGCLASAAILLLASGRPWLTLSLDLEPPLPPVSEKFSGSQLLGLVPIGILAGAAGLALIASRRVGRLIVGVGLVLAGLLALARVGFFLDDRGFLVALDWAEDYVEPGVSDVPNREVSMLPAVIALLGATLVVAVGVFALARSRGWPIMGARYERRGPSSVGNDEAAMWSALERGQDPTATSPDPRAAEAAEAAEPPDQPVTGG